jgi:hypothetical protein
MQGLEGGGGNKLWTLLRQVGHSIIQFLTHVEWTPYSLVAIVSELRDGWLTKRSIPAMHSRRWD